MAWGATSNLNQAVSELKCSDTVPWVKPSTDSRASFTGKDNDAIFLTLAKFGKDSKQYLDAVSELKCSDTVPWGWVKPSTDSRARRSRKQYFYHSNLFWHGSFTVLRNSQGIMTSFAAPLEANM
ncbi:hypothetical protein CAPTEDRAFT_226488 [Capitella teleta]|uniref:Uncharacterized protein n=1 Tax=Capitella teleta TaxID=283909 RepID=R7UJ76_CAPTE|nr:hypothetical protein CAPTEDRAFT_226488 [Capitella teleta]|eukprot:ELU03848.1 hypothetical protein CAPTEDRAFT_226488 [Capitella teleta]